jgi:hypothetical protein
VLPEPLTTINKDSARAARVPKRADDPLTKRAHELTKFAFEQPLKPVSKFPAVLKRIYAALESGRSDEEVRATIVAGDVVWTNEGLHYAIIRATRGNANGEVSYNTPAVRYR